MKRLLAGLISGMTLATQYRQRGVTEGMDL